MNIRSPLTNEMTEIEFVNSESVQSVARDSLLETDTCISEYSHFFEEALICFGLDL